MDEKEEIMDKAKSNSNSGLHAQGHQGVADVSEPSTSKQPDESRVPNAESLAAIRQARTKKGLLSYNSVDELMADLFDDE